MTTQIGEYDHLNAETPLVLRFDGVTISLTSEAQMRGLVTGILESNYGLHRFISELIRQLETGGGASLKFLTAETALLQEFLDKQYT